MHTKDLMFMMKNRGWGGGIKQGVKDMGEGGRGAAERKTGRQEERKIEVGGKKKRQQGRKSGKVRVDGDGWKDCE